MKHVFLGIMLVISIAFTSCGKAQVAKVQGNPSTSPATRLNLQTVETACGQCQFGMKGEGCNLAIRIDDKTYWVDGTGIDDHGDAHSEEGLCNCIRQAVVSGEVRDGRIEVVDFKVNAKTDDSE